MPKLIEVCRWSEKIQPNGYIKDNVLHYYKSVWGKSTAPGASWESLALPDEGDFGALPAPVEMLKWAEGLAHGRPVALFHRGNGDGTYSMMAAILGKVEDAAPAPTSGVLLLPTIAPDGSVHLGAINLGGVATGARLGVVADGTDGLYLAVTGDGKTFGAWRKIPN